ncbi:sensor histidine kinase [Mucilaginibacter sp. RCC_168]|uniref:sensor histidine kinase n=1 Tax=Mucilaginibacter sp. RCC_168 TaxID=3239221 RepID=UPI003524550A
MDLSLKKALAEKAHAELQYQFSSAQNAFLKQQINPHLLFNSLNAIYSTVYQSSPKESKAVLLLSEIIRYSFEEPGTDGRVSLDNELAQLQNLIELNSYRFDYPMSIDLSIHGDPKKYTIIPLILITLTENMFKHGDLRFSPRSINIEIDDKGRMAFTTVNIPRRIKESNENTHIGLANTRLRLDYAYPNNYTLNLTETEKLFILELTVNLNS